MYHWAIVHHEDGTSFGVTFADLPDCFAAADEEEDVMTAAIAALADYAADAELPTAASLPEVRSRFAGDLATGACLIRVPLLSRDT